MHTSNCPSHQVHQCHRLKIFFTFTLQRVRATCALINSVDGVHFIYTPSYFSDVVGVLHPSTRELSHHLSRNVSLVRHLK